MTQWDEKSTPQVASTFKYFERMVSRHRLARYRRATANKQEAIALYLWNVALCEALYPPIHFFEVALRNATHQAISAHCSGGTRWFLDAAVLTEERHQKQVVEAVREIRKKNKGHFLGRDDDPSFPKEPQRVVAELSLGFWINLFSSPYTTSLVSIITPDVFPHGPSEVVKNKRQDVIYPRLREVLGLRNRVFHHEPIYHWTLLSGNDGLIAQHRRLCEVISWMCCVQPFFLQSVDHFVAVHEAGTRPFLDATEFAFLQDEERVSVTDIAALDGG